MPNYECFGSRVFELGNSFNRKYLSNDVVIQTNLHHCSGYTNNQAVIYVCGHVVFTYTETFDTSNPSNCKYREEWRRNMLSHESRELLKCKIEHIYEKHIYDDSLKNSISKAVLEL